MIKELRFHGHIGKCIEYYATVAGPGLMHRHLYESTPKMDRFFYAGKEFVMNEEGIRHGGNGGSFCEYMFGIEQPIKDLIRKDVVNRLATYGASFDKDSGKLIFTKHTDGTLDYEKIFLEGNAVSNYHFFLNLDIKGDIRKQQEAILKLTGKTLKYSAHIAQGADSKLVTELMADLDGYKPVVFVFRLIHRYNKRYYDLFKELYDENKEIGDEGNYILSALATEFKINQYQQERIKLDVTYNHPENKRVVDEYKDVLISFEDVENLGRTDIASLNRLRALAIKNNIPHYLFDMLDEVLLKGKKLDHVDEPDYIKESRVLLDGLFSLEKGNLDSVISKDGIVKLLINKKSSMDNKDFFDGLLLEIGKNCDEMFEKGDTSAFDRFSELITFFDRFDNSSMGINNLAFMAEDVSVEKLRSVLGNKRVFDEIKPDLFESLFFTDLLVNRYLTYSGRRKINALSKGLKDVEDGYKALNVVADEISAINVEDKTYEVLYNVAKDRLKKIPGAMNGKDEHDNFLKEVLKSLLHDGPVDKIPKKTMKRVFTALKMEGFYTTEILPIIIESGDMAMREDFLTNSGFDRFFIEDIERAYIDSTEPPEDKVRNFKELVEQGNATQPA
jgi:uncharacterized protein (TIGR04442 family)